MLNYNYCDQTSEIRSKNQNGKTILKKLISSESWNSNIRPMRLVSYPIDLDNQLARNLNQPG